MSSQHLMHIALVVRDYDEAIKFYTEKLNFQLVEDSAFSTDTNLGFAGGDVNPLVPGNRFRIFDTH